MNTRTPPPDTLPCDAVLLKRKHNRFVRAPKLDGRIGWSRSFGQPFVEYYWSEKENLWKKVKPNPKARERRERFHRGASVNPASHRGPGIEVRQQFGVAALIGATVLETAEGGIGLKESDDASTTSPEEHEKSGSSKWPDGNGD